MCADTPELPDYKDTLHLPQTDFPMRAGLPKREPDWLAKWEKINVYERFARQGGGGEPRLRCMTGPPYANGHLHIGHALNKILKDMVVRSQQMLGRDARYIPGWDCPRSADRMEDRREIPPEGTRQGRRAVGRVPAGMS